jgi:hypothetical protein
VNNAYAERTGIANAGVLLAEQYAQAFVGVVISGDVPRYPTLTEPEGQSTMGGAHARQHLTLRARVAGHPTFTVGWANIPEHRALLRTHGCVAEIYRQRFGNQTFDLDEIGYQRFFDRTRSFFLEQGFLVDVETRAPRTTRPPPDTKIRRRRAPVFLLLALLLALAGLIAWLLSIR